MLYTHTITATGPITDLQWAEITLVAKRLAAIKGQGAANDNDDGNPSLVGELICDDFRIHCTSTMGQPSGFQIFRGGVTSICRTRKDTRFSTMVLGTLMAAAQNGYYVGSDADWTAWFGALLSAGGHLPKSITLNVPDNLNDEEAI